MTNFNERTITLLYKNISPTLYSRKGDVSCVWEVSGDKDGLLFGPKVLPTIAAVLLHLGCVAQPWVTEGPKPSVCCWLSIRHVVSNWLKPSVCWLYYSLTSTCFNVFFCLFTQVHLRIDGSVEGQSVTYIYHPFLSP